MREPAGCAVSSSPLEGSLTAAAISKAIRATTEAHLLCYGAFAVIKALTELRDTVSTEAPVTALALASVDDDIVVDVMASEVASEADYEP